MITEGAPGSPERAAWIARTEAEAASSAVSVVFETTNGQTLTVVRDADSGAVTLRVAKDGHNRAVAKLDSFTGDQLGRFLAPMAWPNPV